MKKTKRLIPILLLLLVLLSIYFIVIKDKETNTGSGIDKTQNPSVTTTKAQVTDTAVAEAETSGTATDFIVPKAGTELQGYTMILHTNDSHGRVSPDASKGQMGFTAVRALKKCYEAAGAKVILLDAGDTLHGTDFASKNNGKRIIELMNLVGYNAMVPGNNDFNYGMNALLKNERKMEFSLISANIKYISNQEDVFQKHFIIEKNGVKYGVFGLTTTDTVIKEDPHDIKSLEFDNPVTAANNEVKELKSEGADIIIALAHLGVDESSEYTSKELAVQVKGINLIVDGHSHSALESGIKMGSTLIVSAGEYIENIGVVTISPQGKMTAQLVNLSEFSETDQEVDDLIAGYTHKK